jgi:hypothetical protein
MEWAIPLQKLEVGKIQIGEMAQNDKYIVPLAYFDGQNNFPNLNILLPMLTVLDFDTKSGKLALLLKEEPQFTAKLSALESTLLGAVYIQQKYWFPSSIYEYPLLHSMYKPIVDNGLLHLYYPIHFNSDVKIYKNNVWVKDFIPGMLEAGSRARIMFRIQGLSFQKNNYTNAWTGKFRLQHRILAIFIE